MPDRLPDIYGKGRDIMPTSKSKRARFAAKFRLHGGEALNDEQLRRLAASQSRTGKARNVSEQTPGVRKSRKPANIPQPPRFMMPDGSVAVDDVAKDLGLTKALLASALGLAEETLQRSARAKAAKTQKRLRDMVEILSRVEPWAGSLPQAFGWYRGQSIPSLGYQTAEALVKNDQADVVRSYLDGLAAGSFA